MDNAEQTLWKKALCEAMWEKHSAELATCTEDIHPSARHLHKVSRILGVDVQQEAGRRYYRKRRVIAFILAAALLLATAVTVYAYRNAIFGFIESVFTDHVEVDFDGIPADAPTTIEEVYELGYVPKGFVQVQERSHERGVRYIFENEKGDTFDFLQSPLNSNTVLGMDNEYGDTEIRNYGGREVYCRISSSNCSFLWRDDKYALQIWTAKPLSDEEILKIMDGVQIKK